MGLVGSIIISKKIEKNRKKQKKIEKIEKNRKKLHLNVMGLVGSIIISKKIEKNRKKSKKITFGCDGFGRIDNNQ